MKIVNGTGIGTKKASGNIKFLKTDSVKEVKNQFTTTEIEKLRLEKSKEKVKENLTNLIKIARKDIGNEEAKIFEIHIMLLEDEDFFETVLNEISQGKCAENAILEAKDKYTKMLNMYQYKKWGFLHFLYQVLKISM